MVNRIKQPEGCIGISEKCVFAGKSLSSRYRESGFFLAIVVLQLKKDKVALGPRRPTRPELIPVSVA